MVLVRAHEGVCVPGSAGGCLVETRARALYGAKQVGSTSCMVHRHKTSMRNVRMYALSEPKTSKHAGGGGGGGGEKNFFTKDFIFLL